MRRKIGIEAQWIYRERKYGLEFTIINYIKALSAAFPTYSIFVFTKDGPSNPGVDALHNVSVLFLPSAPYPVWEQVLLPRALRSHQVHLLHCTSNTAPIRCPVPLVVTLRDLHFMENGGGKGGSWVQQPGYLYRRWVVSKIAKTADALVTVSKYEAGKIEKTLNLKSGSVTPVYDAVNDWFWSEPKDWFIEKTLEKYNVEETPVMVFPGGTEPRKNVSGVLMAYYRCWEQKKNLPKLFMPDCPEAFVNKWIQQQGIDAGFLNQFILPGYVSNDEFQCILLHAELLLYPSLYESFGRPVLEGFACRIPVITGNTSSMAEIAGDGAVLVNPASVEEIQEAILDVLSWPEEQLEQKAQQGLSQLKRFTLKKTAKQLVEVYDRIHRWKEPKRTPPKDKTFITLKKEFRTKTD